MTARVVRIAFLLAAVAATLALAPSASAAVARGAGSEASSSADECAGPCPTVVVFKGPGAGRLSSTPVGVNCVTPGPCDFYPDNETLGTSTFEIHVHPNSGSYLQQWENCVPPGGRVTSAGSCVLDISASGARYTLCVVLNVSGRAAVPTIACPPPASPLPPLPPPPSTPPRPGSRCTISGTAGSNVINGTSGRDVICGRGGNDRINGRGGHDLILGGPGRDRLVGGAGRDAVYGNSGNDTLLTRDGARDTVNGGRGRDRARWDARDVRRSIERRL
jgi:RTX calcium-binding nonapeptide repeat (4 copies)